MHLVEDRLGRSHVFPLVTMCFFAFTEFVIPELTYDLRLQTCRMIFFNSMLVCFLLAELFLQVVATDIVFLDREIRFKVVELVRCKVLIIFPIQWRSKLIVPTQNPVLISLASIISPVHVILA